MPRSFPGAPAEGPAATTASALPGRAPATRAESRTGQSAALIVNRHCVVGKPLADDPRSWSSLLLVVPRR
jgi:hypothetical protein